VKFHSIAPGRPAQSPSREFFSGKFRNECLDQILFNDLVDARTKIERRRTEYNTERPHSSQNYEPLTKSPNVTLIGDPKTTRHQDFAGRSEL